MNTTWFYKFFSQDRICSKGHKNCCALYCLKSPLRQPAMDEKVVERYANEHHPNKIFT